MEGTSVKDEARRIVQELAENASWDDLMERINVRQAIEAGLRDSDAGCTDDAKDVRASFGLEP